MGYPITLGTCTACGGWRMERVRVGEWRCPCGSASISTDDPKEMVALDIDVAHALFIREMHYTPTARLRRVAYRARRIIRGWLP